jgi:hypothetical protein
MQPIKTDAETIQAVEASTSEQPKREGAEANAVNSQPRKRGIRRRTRSSRSKTKSS